MASQHALEQSPIRVAIDCCTIEPPDGFAILDQLMLFVSGFETYCLGQVSSVAALILAIGNNRKRYAIKDASVTRSFHGLMTFRCAGC